MNGSEWEPAGRLQALCAAGRVRVTSVGLGSGSASIWCPSLVTGVGPRGFGAFAIILGQAKSPPVPLIAVFEEEELQQGAAVSPAGGSVTGPSPSPDPYDSELSVFQPIREGEIEVNSSALKSIATAGPALWREDRRKRERLGLTSCLLAVLEGVVVHPGIRTHLGP
ncbi:hypothetical protein COCON_G00054850 [Conger conger]|uniref:Uncharacterized protein n=1 Tax=Conger conger TaxID=82655 RepID=A0A9Q1DW74_CONCO|nr:hypothetical protein COCON_G00054850 [Conger conger]